MKGNNDTQVLDRLYDFIVEDIILATDEAILQELAEDYSDPDKVIASVQASIGKARLAVSKRKLSEAKDGITCASLKRVRSTNEFDDNQIRRIFEKVTTQNRDLRLSIAARKGKDLTLQDMRSLLDDLQDLGCDLSEFINGDQE